MVLGNNLKMWLLLAAALCVTHPHLQLLPFTPAACAPTMPPARHLQASPSTIYQDHRVFYYPNKTSQGNYVSMLPTVMAYLANASNAAPGNGVSNPWPNGVIPGGYIVAVACNVVTPVSAFVYGIAALYNSIVATYNGAAKIFLMLEYGGPYSNPSIPASCLANFATALRAQNVALGSDVYVDDEMGYFSSSVSAAVVSYVKNSSANGGFAQGIQFVVGHGASGHKSNGGFYWPAWSSSAGGTLMLYAGAASPGVCATPTCDGQSYNAEYRFNATWYANPDARLIFGTGGLEPVLGGNGPTSAVYLASQLEYAMGTPCKKPNGNPCAYQHVTQFTNMVAQGRVDWYTGC